MKISHLKFLIKEIVRYALTEGRIKDPTKEEMMAFLHKSFDRLMDQKNIEEDGEEAMYWFANFNHGGQWSNLYSVLSTSVFTPGRIQRGPERGSAAEYMLNALSHEFGDGKDWDGGDGEEDEMTETNGVREPHPNDVYDRKEIAKYQELFHKEIEQLKAKFPQISFGYIGNYWTDARYQPQDDMAWYVWNGKNKFGGYITKDLPKMWGEWQKRKEQFLSQPIREAVTNTSRKFTVSYAVLGLEQIPDSTHDTRDEAMQAARAFIQSYNTNKSKQAGEKVVPFKNGYALQHVDGGTRAVAKVGSSLYEANSTLSDEWISVDEPPEDDRLVQLMWDDGSTGPNAVGFFDSKSGRENEGRIWWSFAAAGRKYPTPLPKGHVIAWKESDKKSGITEAGVMKENRVSNSERSKIGLAFKKRGLDGNGRFEKKEYALREMTDALSELGFQLDMVTADLIIGDKGSRNLIYRRSNDSGQDSFTEKPEIINSRIVFIWEQLDERAFEVMAYAS